PRVVGPLIAKEGVYAEHDEEHCANEAGPGEGHWKPGADVFPAIERVVPDEVALRDGLVRHGERVLRERLTGIREEGSPLVAGVGIAIRPDEHRHEDLEHVVPAEA